MWTAPVPHEITKIAYLKRFTQAERIAIRNAGAVNDQVKDYIELLNSASGTVLLTDPLTSAGLYALEAAGFLGPGRAAEILA